MPDLNPALEPLLDKIATHLATQYGLSLLYQNNTTACCYRGANDRSCAVGCLITDEQMERYHVEEATAANELCRDLLEDLQNEYAPEAGNDQFLHALLCAQRYHDGGWNHLTPSYLDRLDEYGKDFPTLKPRILHDLQDRYTKTRFNE